jgi:hypothetical protein
MGDPCVEAEETHDVSQEAKGMAMEACLFQGNVVSRLH